MHILWDEGSSTNKRGAVPQSLVYNLMSSARSENPIEFNYFLVVEKHVGRGMAIAICKGLKTPVLTVLSQWCKCSRELQGIRLQKLDKETCLSDQYIHTTATGSTKASWDILEEKGDEDELGNQLVSLCL